MLWSITEALPAWVCHCPIIFAAAPVWIGQNRPTTAAGSVPGRNENTISLYAGGLSSIKFIPCVLVVTYVTPVTVSAIHIRKVPERLLQQIKVRAAQQGLTQRAWVIAAVRGALSQRNGASQ